MERLGIDRAMTNRPLYLVILTLRVAGELLCFGLWTINKFVQFGLFRIKHSSMNYREKQSGITRVLDSSHDYFFPLEVEDCTLNV